MNDNGALRHILTRNELQELYRKLDNFIADCTEQEAKENQDTFVKIKTFIHQRMRNS